MSLESTSKPTFQSIRERIPRGEPEDRIPSGERSNNAPSPSARHAATIGHSCADVLRVQSASTGKKGLGRIAPGVAFKHCGGLATEPVRGMTSMGQRGGTYDVVVAGYGAAGASAAIAAADAGASVLLVEKAPHLGGLSLLSSGYMRVADDVGAAADYLTATSGGRVPAELVIAFAEGMVRLPAILESLCEHVGASWECKFGGELGPHQTSDLYDWAGRESLGWAGVTDVAGFAGYAHAAKSRGALLMRMLELNVRSRSIDVWLEAAARDLVVDRGVVVGVDIAKGRSDDLTRVDARGGVVLATAGFEFSPTMTQDYFELPIVYPVGHRWNTGDGVRMSQSVGADLWHMWHFHGSYGFKFSEFDFAFRHHLGGARRDSRVVAWIVVDQNGRRFMNEVPRAPQDTAWRDLAYLNDASGCFDRIPSWLVFDETGRKLGPIGKTTWSDSIDRYVWSSDNSEEIDRGWIKSAASIDDLACQIGVPAEDFSTAIAEWNRGVADKKDPFGRPSGTCAEITTPPFYAIETWPVCTNTQGGPRHDHLQRVLDPRGRVIEGLYAVGELGSFFGHIYLLGGNLTEGISGGAVAGRHAAEGAHQPATAPQHRRSIEPDKRPAIMGAP